MAFALRFPDALFRVAAKGMLSVDMNARSSMWEDLRAGRSTEIDYLQGEIVRLADEYGVEVPVNQRVLKLIKDAERAKKGSPGLAPGTIGAAR
jgi:2-dehydropantoate 2-reductase